MSKDVNIHVKSTGTQQVKQELSGVGRSAEQMGSRTKRASNWIKEGLKSLVGPLGFAAIATALAAASLKVAKFFDNLKTLCDEAVRNVQGLRKEFAELFEAMDAYDERSRRQITKQTVALLKETAVSKEIGLPIINAYTRQYRDMVESGQLTEAQYQQGLKGMLGYGERHGGVATAELVALMRGWGIVTPEQQGVFRRQISAGAAASGLTDAELIGALGRGMPTIKAMGWTPTQAVETIATIAAGEVGRKRASLPATTLQGLIAPQLTNIAKYGISEKIAQDPQQLLMQLQSMRGQMDQQKYTRMLVEIYGNEAAAGVSKLLTASRGGIREAITQAATAEGAAAEQREEQTSRETEERLLAKAEAAVIEENLDVTTREQYEEKIRRIGKARRERLKRREPVRQWIREFFTIGEEAEYEEAARRKWMESLTPEESAAIEEEYLGYAQRYERAWREMTPQERYEGLTRQAPAIETHYHNEHIINYYPRQDYEKYRAPPGLQ